MKRWTALLLATAMCFSLVACGGGNSDESKNTDDSGSVGVQVDEGLFNVDITIAKTFFTNMTEDEIKESAKENGFDNCVVNEDGSVTYTMSKSKHKEMLNELKTNLEEKVADMLEGENAVASFVSIDYADDFSKFDIYVNEQYSIWDNFYVLALYLSGAYYQSFAGVSADNVDVVVNFIDNETKESLDSASYRNWISSAEGESSEGNTADDTAVTTDKVTKFEQNQDLRVVAAFNYDNDTYVVVENVGEQAILNYRVAYISFDKNGFVATTDSDGYDTGKYDTANLMPGQKAISSWYGADGDYTVATVIGVDYQDGSSWEAKHLEKWAETTRTEFDVSEHKAELANLKQLDAQAESNEYAVLTEHYIKHGNRFSSKHDFHFSIENTSDRGITELRLFVLEFDENGFPVSVSPYDTYCKNGHSTGGTVNLEAGASGSYSDSLFISPTTTQIKVIISRIEFQDGTEWTNPFIYEWVIANNSSY